MNENIKNTKFKQVGQFVYRTVCVFVIRESKLKLGLQLQIIDINNPKYNIITKISLHRTADAPAPRPNPQSP